jgi:hypothetical protein
LHEKKFFREKLLPIKAKNKGCPDHIVCIQSAVCITQCINIQYVRRMTRCDYIRIVRRINKSSIDELYKVIRLIKDNISDNMYSLFNYVCNS